MKLSIRCIFHAVTVLCAFTLAGGVFAADLIKTADIKTADIKTADIKTADGVLEGWIGASTTFMANHYLRSKDIQFVEELLPAFNYLTHLRAPVSN